MSMSSRITNTGPIPAHIDGMTVSMYAELSGAQYTDPTARGSPVSAFAKVQLPPITVLPDGVDVVVKDQRIEICHARGFHIFNRNLINQSELPLHLVSRGTIRVFGMSTPIEYRKRVTLKGMEGIHITVLQTRKAGGSLLSGSPGAMEVDVAIENKSCVSMEMGVVHVGILRQGILISNLHAEMALRPGDNRVTFTGTLKILNMLKNPKFGATFLRKDLKGEQLEAWVIGERGEQTGWIDGVVKEMKSPIVLDSTLRDIYRSIKES